MNTIDMLAEFQIDFSEFAVRSMEFVWSQYTGSQNKLVDSQRRLIMRMCGQGIRQGGPFFSQLKISIILTTGKWC